MNNRVGLHTNYFRGTRWEWDLFAVAQFVHEAGGNVLELMPDQLLRMDDKTLWQFRDLTERLDIELIVGAGRNMQTDPSKQENQEASYAHTLKMLHLLAAVGCHKWDGLIHASWPGKPPVGFSLSQKQEYLERSACAMRRIAPLLDEFDIDVYFEVVNRFEHFLLNTAEEGMNFCRQIGHPRFHLLLDTFHMNIEENSIVKSICCCAAEGYLGHFHVGEANRSVPGTVESHMDWDGIFGALKSSEYRGSIILEPFIVSGCAFSNNVSLWRDLSEGADITKLKEYAATGISFVKSYIGS